MSKYIRIHVVAALFIALLPGCTTRGWYEGGRTGAQLACQRQPPSEREQCEARLNKDDFDTYQKNRARK